MLQEEIQYLKLENNKLKENNNTQLKITELLSEQKCNHRKWKNVRKQKEQPVL